MSTERPETAGWPSDDYWDKSRFYWFYDNDRMCGVSDNSIVLHWGMSKEAAAATACLLNGDIDLARSILS